jgi:hypothetical protein
VESQRKTAKNYRFSWDPLMVGDMEEELRTLQTDSTSGDLYDIQEEDQSQSDKEDEGGIFSVGHVFGPPGSISQVLSGLK